MSDRVARTWIALWLLVVASVASAGQVNIGQVVNAGFELDADKNGIPDGWERAGCDMPQVVALDGKSKKEGEYSFRLESAKPTDNHFCQPVKLQPGAIYRVSAWIKTKGYKPVGGPEVRATISVRTQRNGQLIECGEPHEGTTDWEQEILDFVAPGNGKAAIACEYGSWGRATGAVWFDGIRLERLADPGRFDTLAEPPRGCHARAEWAMRRNPRDWATLAGALESFYAQGGARQRGRIAAYLGALTTAAQGDPQAHAALRDLYAKHAWRIDLSELAAGHITPLLEEAAKLAAKDPKTADVARSARLGAARLRVIYGEEAPAAAAKTLAEAIGDNEETRQQTVNILLRDAKHLQTKGGGGQARRIYAVLLAFVPAGASQRSAIQSANLQHLMALGEGEAARSIAERLVAPDSKASPSLRRQALLALSSLSVRAGRAEQTQQWLALADKQFTQNRGERARFHLDFAKALAKDERWDEAAKTCQKVAASFPQERGTCFEAQRLLVECAMKQRLYDQALAAAKILYGAAPNSEKEITDAVNLAMRALKARYRSIALANDFVAFQSHGPNGKDGKKGTEDDIEDPLAREQWTPPAEIEALFKRTLAGLSEDFLGRRWRGYLYLYWGKPGLALKEFVRRYDEAPLEQKAMDEAIDDLVVALKAYCGHTLAGERFTQYQKYGPKGEDGKRGTEDDLTDPLRDILGK